MFIIDHELPSSDNSDCDFGETPSADSSDCFPPNKIPNLFQNLAFEVPQNLALMTVITARF